MNCILTDSTAADFLHTQRLCALASLVQANNSVLSKSTANIEEIDASIRKAVGIGRSVVGSSSEPLSAAKFLGIDELPIQVLVDSEDKRRANELVASHLCTTALPSGSLLQIADGLYTVSPELSFIQQATKLDVPDLVMLGLEMCGSYTLNSSVVCDFKYRPSLTNAAKLRKFIASAMSIRGRKRAAVAAKYVVDGSASPRESALCALLTLDTKYGGYGLPLPTLNERIDIGTRAQAYDSRSFLRADLYWSDCKLDVEYDSTLHAGETQRARDASRLNVLRKLGIQLVQVTTHQMKTPGELDRIVLGIRDIMGLRNRPAPMGVIYKRDALRRKLIAPTFTLDEQSNPSSVQALVESADACVDEWLYIP